MSTGLVILLAAIGIGLGVSRWTLGIQAALLFAIFEGAFRKWVAPGSSNYIYFIKDAILIASYMGAILSDRKVRVLVPEPITILVGFTVVLVGLQVFNLNQGSLITGLFGLKCYLIYLPLMFLLNSVFPTPKDMTRFIMIFVLTAGPIGLLGGLQYFASPESPLNVYSQEADEWGVATFGDEIKRARITGTFSYIAGFSTYLVIIFSFCIAFLTKHQPFRDRIITGILLALCFGNMLMTGSRSTLVYILINLVTVAWVLRGNLAVAGKHLVTIAAALGVCLLVSQWVFHDASDAMRGRLEGDDSLIKRIGWLSLPFEIMDDVGTFGLGVGVTHPARVSLERIFDLKEPQRGPVIGAEIEALQTMQELGLIGFVIWNGMKIAILYYLWQMTDRLRSPFLKTLGASAVAYHIAHLYLSTVTNHIAGLYFWFFSGFLFLLPRLDVGTSGVLVVHSQRRRTARGRRAAQQVVVAPTKVRRRLPRLGRANHAR